MTDTVISSATREVVIGFDRPFVLIGERINPTGRKALAEEMKAGDFSRVERDVLAQVEAGAHMLDVNAGIPLADEPAILAQTIELVQSITDVPLCIDSNDPKILEAGLSAAPGKPLVNSVNGEDKQLSAVLPIVKARGAAVIGLTIGDNGIPRTAEERLAVAGKIIEYAAKMGIPAEDIIIDPLVMTVGHDSSAALTTLKTIELIKKEYGVNVNLGASNVSFGLPDRHSVNSAFLSLAIQMGATCSITDPIKLGSTIRATDLLLSKDANSIRYLKYFRATEKLREQEAAVKA
jgi:5-methyltetrahydrofolate--homocysteine methyltransferase